MLFRLFLPQALFCLFIHSLPLQILARRFDDASAGMRVLHRAFLRAEITALQPVMGCTWNGVFGVCGWLGGDFFDARIPTHAVFFVCLDSKCGTV